MGLLNKLKSALGFKTKKQFLPKIEEPLKVIQPVITDDNSRNRKNHRKSLLLDNK